MSRHVPYVVSLIANKRRNSVPNISNVCIIYNMPQHIISSFICVPFCSMSNSLYSLFAISLSNSQPLSRPPMVTPRSTSFFSYSVTLPHLSHVLIICLFVLQYRRLFFPIVSVHTISVHHCLSFNIRSAIVFHSMSICLSFSLSIIVHYRFIYHHFYGNIACDL